jgi:HSP20 family protein
MLPVRQFRSEMAPLAGASINRLDSFFDRVFGEDNLYARAWDGMPVAVWEDEDLIHVEAELPGMSEQDLDITVHKGMLFIRGERKPQEGRTYLVNGRFYGRFERAIALPEAVNTDGVKASLSCGVLTVTLPKSPEARPRKIALETT